jgi:hypothetical protein
MTDPQPQPRKPLFGANGQLVMLLVISGAACLYLAFKLAREEFAVVISDITPQPATPPDVPLPEAAE